MYNAANTGDGNGEATQEQGNPADEVTDVDFEEVNDKK